MLYRAHVYGAVVLVEEKVITCAVKLPESGPFKHVFLSMHSESYIYCQCCLQTKGELKLTQNRRPKSENRSTSRHRCWLNTYGLGFDYAAVGAMADQHRKC